MNDLARVQAVLSAMRVELDANGIVGGGSSYIVTLVNGERRHLGVHHAFGRCSVSVIDPAAPTTARMFEVSDDGDVSELPARINGRVYTTMLQSDASFGTSLAITFETDRRIARSRIDLPDPPSAHDRQQN